MSNYTKSTNFAAKDALLTGNPLKSITGTGIDDEFNAIAVAVATKADSISPTFTTPNLGTPASGVLTNCTGTAAGLSIGGNAATATTATDTASKTGTGSTYVTNTSPTLVTPNLGTPSALVGTNITGTAAGLSIGGSAYSSTIATNLNGGVNSARLTTVDLSASIIKITKSYAASITNAVNEEALNFRVIQGGVYRVSYHCKSSGSGGNIAVGSIFVDGVIVGSEQTFDNVGVTVTADITIPTGGTIQLILRAVSTFTAIATAFNFAASKSSVIIPPAEIDIGVRG